MKIIKHCHEESTSNIDMAQGALLGLIVDKCLEITNCFPFSTTDESVDDEEYQLTMMRRLRRVNVDHFHVGWYQNADVGNFLTIPFVDSQFHYQTRYVTPVPSRRLQYLPLSYLPLQHPGVGRAHL